MAIDNPTIMIPEAALLDQASEWLAAQPLDVAALRSLAQVRGLDFATAVLYQALRESARHGPIIAQLERPAPPSTLRQDADILIAPGAFYKEKPDSGADGRLIKEAAHRLGYATQTIPLGSFATMADNGALIADCLRQRRARPVVLVSHSKATLEVRHLLARSDAGELFQNVRAWIDLSGLFFGTPLIGWLRAHRFNWQLSRLLFWWYGLAFSALNEIDHEACLPWPNALKAVPHLDVFHVIGFPLERHLSTPLAQRGYQRMAHLGPNDGTILLEDVFALPGHVYPVWGADHYLRPAYVDKTHLMANILLQLAGSSTFAVSREFA